MSTAPHEKYWGKNASKAPRWSIPIQIRGPQAIPADSGNEVVAVVVVEVVILYLVARSGRGRGVGAVESSRPIHGAGFPRTLHGTPGGLGIAPP